MARNRVNESSQNERVYHVGAEPAPLRDGAANDRGRRAGKNVEEEEVDEAIPVSHEEEVALAQERVPALPQREAEPDGPVGEGGSAPVEHIFEQNVLGVLGADGPHLEEAEARLHQEAEDGRGEDPQAVDGRHDLGVVHPVGRLQSSQKVRLIVCSRVPPQLHSGVLALCICSVET